MPDSLDAEYTLAGMVLQALPISLVSHLIAFAEPLVQDDDTDGTEDREKRYNRRDPKRPREGTEVLRNDIRCRLADVKC